IETALAKQRTPPRAIRRKSAADARRGVEPRGPRGPGPGVLPGGTGDGEHLPAGASALLETGRPRALAPRARPRRGARRRPRPDPPQIPALRAHRGGPGAAAHPPSQGEGGAAFEGRLSPPRAPGRGGRRTLHDRDGRHVTRFETSLR